jgi:hypothetical protein
MLTNKIKSLAIIVVISASIVITMGICTASSGFENLIFAYLTASIFGGITSTIYANKVMKHASSIIFSRMI